MDALKKGNKVRLKEQPSIIGKVSFVSDMLVVVRWPKKATPTCYPAKSAGMFVEVVNG